MESTNYVFNVSDFGFTDVIDGDNFQAVEIVSLPIPGAGSLQVNGANVVAGQIVNVADIIAGKLVFSPLAWSQWTGSWVALRSEYKMMVVRLLAVLILIR